MSLLMDFGNGKAFSLIRRNLVAGEVSPDFSDPTIKHPIMFNTVNGKNIVYLLNGKTFEAVPVDNFLADNKIYLGGINMVMNNVIHVFDIPGEKHDMLFCYNSTEECEEVFNNLYPIFNPTWIEPSEQFMEQEKKYWAGLLERLAK